MIERLVTKPSLTVGLLPRGNDEVLPEPPVNAGRGSSPTVREGSIKSYGESRKPRRVIEATGSQEMTPVDAVGEIQQKGPLESGPR